MLPSWYLLHTFTRLQNSPNFGVFKYARAVKQKVWNEARALCARTTLTPRFTDFFTDFEKKTDCFAVYTFTGAFRVCLKELIYNLSTEFT